MAAIAVGEREEWAAPQRVKPVHSGVLSGPERGSSKSRGRLVRLLARRKRFVAFDITELNRVDCGGEAHPSRTWPRVACLEDTPVENSQSRLQSRSLHE